MFKKTYKLAFLAFAILLPYSLTYALSSDEKGAILDDFKQRQYDLIFESNLWDISSEFSDIFNISWKMNIYNNIWDKAKNDREEIQAKNEEVIKKISSLQESIDQLDSDISVALIRVKRINESIIETKSEIDINTKTVEILKKKISENMELLLEYMSYIYKKWNTVYSDRQVDNLKSILLNEENIWDVINDLYYNSIVQITWKDLIDKHRKYISELYLKKVELENKETNLKELRKMSIIEKKTLDDKRDFKARILEASKWQQALYEKFVADKLKIEKKLEIKSFQEKVKFNSIRDGILKKYNCEFVDISKNTSESRNLTWKCLDINKMIYSESKLGEAKTVDYNYFEWPVNPIKWISTAFHDAEYMRDFGSEHDAIDIKTNQWTSIKAPADWYVIYVEKPVSADYAYVVLKHPNWYITVYWHVSNVFVEEFEFVQKWQVFAETWGAYGTNGAGYLSTWPHLHFEVFKDKEYIDPFTVVDLSYIRYAEIPEKYKFKYYNDFKLRRWYEFKDQSKNSSTFKLEWKDEIERQQYLISKYAVWAFNNWQMWIDESLDSNIDPSFVMCVWLAETWLWKHLKTAYNIWNVWNTDSWATREFTNARSWIYAMIRTFNNKYLSQYDEVSQLSRYWNKNLKKPIYASSDFNWHNNIIKCLSHLKWTYVPDDYNFRIVD